MHTTAYSACPTPTVSTKITLKLAASHRNMVSRVVRVTPPETKENHRNTDKINMQQIFNFRFIPRLPLLGDDLIKDTIYIYILIYFY